MDAAPSAEIVCHAINALFHDSNFKEKEKANKWLEQFQKSIYSWSIADELLQQKRDLHSCYFAAQTMRNKIQTSFYELPPESHESLRDSLIGHICQINEQTDAIIVTQLSLAVADLALLMAAWQQPIIDLLETMAKQPQSVWPLLEILMLIPEEMDSRYLRLGANRREEIYQQLDNAAPRVLEFLGVSLQHSEASHNLRLLNATMRCFSSWVAIQAVPVQHFAESTTAGEVFRLLGQNDTSRKLHDTVTECMCALLNCIDSKNNRFHVEPLLATQVFNGVCGLEAAYHISVAQEDVDKAMNYCRIFTVLSEAFFYEMLSYDETRQVQYYNPLKALDLVLVCVGHFDYEVAQITFNLWYRLSEELFERNDEKLTARFKPHVERLVGALYRHAQIDGDHEGLIDESDSFNDFRRKVSDLIKDVAFIVGSGTCFKQMFLTLQTPNTTWESTEAALFIMQNVAKNIIPDENDVIPKVVEAILNMPVTAHIAVRNTSILLLGELCDWIENHHESLQAVLNFLLFSLQQKNGLAAAAAIALTSICTACRQKMTYHINGLVQIARSLDSFEISNDLAIGLLKGISLILSRLPRNNLESTMREIVSFQLQPLAHLVADNNTQLCKGERNDPAYWIDRACAIIRFTNPDSEDTPDNEGAVTTSHPTLIILTDAWPLIERVLEKYQTDVRIMERTCRFIRYGIRMVRKQASALVVPLLKQIVCLYAANRHSCFLYLGSVLVDEFASSEECIPALLEMLQAFIQPTFTMLQVENGLKNHPDTIDDFFRLCSRFIDCCPLPFLQSGQLVTPIVQCALLASTLDHREANSSVMKFFSNLLKWGRSSNYRFAACRQLVREIVEQHGQALTTNLIHSSVFYLHSYMLPDVAEVITELKSVASQEQLQGFLKTALDGLPKQNSGGAVTATQEQLDEFSTSVLRAEHTKTVSQSLKIFARLYR